MSSEQLSQLASEPTVEEIRQPVPGDDSASPKTVPHPQSFQDSQDSQDTTGSETSSQSKSSDGSIDTLACPSPVIEADGYVISEPPSHHGGQNPTVVHHHDHRDKFSFVTFKTEEIHHHHHHHVTTHVHHHHHYHFVGCTEEKVDGSLLALECHFLRNHSEMGVPTQVDPLPEGGWGSHPGALVKCPGTEIIESDLDNESDRPTKLRRMNAADFSDPEEETWETMQVKDA